MKKRDSSETEEAKREKGFLRTWKVGKKKKKPHLNEPRKRSMTEAWRRGWVGSDKVTHWRGGREMDRERSGELSQGLWYLSGATGGWGSFFLCRVV